MYYIPDASKGASLQKNRLEMENHNSTCTPKTSPLPRSGLTKITGTVYINKQSTLIKIPGSPCIKICLENVNFVLHVWEIMVYNHLIVRDSIMHNQQDWQYMYV